MKLARHFLPLVLLPVLATALADGGLTQPVPAGVFRNEQMGFELFFPVGWYRFTQLSPMGTQSFCSTPDMADGSSYVYVRTLPAGTALDEKSVLDEVRGDEDEDKFTVEMDSLQARDKGGGKARLLKGSTVADGDPMYYYAVVISAGSRGLLLLVIEGPPDTLKSAGMKLPLQAMLTSFKAIGG